VNHISLKKPTAILSAIIISISTQMLQVSVAAETPKPTTKPTTPAKPVTPTTKPTTPSKPVTPTTKPTTPSKPVTPTTKPTTPGRQTTPTKPAKPGPVTINIFKGITEKPAGASDLAWSNHKRALADAEVALNQAIVEARKTRAAALEKTKGPNGVVDQRMVDMIEKNMALARTNAEKAQAEAVKSADAALLKASGNR